MITHTTTNLPGIETGEQSSKEYSAFRVIHAVIPERVQAKIVHLRDEHDRLQWMLGDLYN